MTLRRTNTIRVIAREDGHVHASELFHVCMPKCKRLGCTNVFPVEQRPRDEGNLSLSSCLNQFNQLNQLNQNSCRHMPVRFPCIILLSLSTGLLFSLVVWLHTCPVSARRPSLSPIQYNSIQFNTMCVCVCQPHHLAALCWGSRGPLN